MDRKDKELRDPRPWKKPADAEGEQHDITPGEQASEISGGPEYYPQGEFLKELETGRPGGEEADEG